MTKLDFSLDMDRVQSSVQAAIRPAVESALASVDLKKKITEALLKPLPKPAPDSYGAFRMLMGAPPDDGHKTLLDRMVQEGINNIAKEYVQRNLREMQPEIERGLQKTMASSASKLSKSFATAIAEAFKEDWGFELDVKVSHTVPERSDDYRDD